MAANRSSVSMLFHRVWCTIADALASSVAGGFAIVQPDSVLSINAVEGYPIEEFSEEAVKSQIAEAQKIAGGSGSEIDIAEAKIELEVCTATTCDVCVYLQRIGAGELASRHEVNA